MRTTTGYEPLATRLPVPDQLGPDPEAGRRLATYPCGRTPSRPRRLGVRVLPSPPLRAKELLAA